MPQASDAVEAVALASAVAEHAHDLRVLLAGLLEFELAFGLLVLILAAPPVLAALALILRHDLRVAASSASCEGTRVFAKVRVFASPRRVCIAAAALTPHTTERCALPRTRRATVYTLRHARSARRLAL